MKKPASSADTGLPRADSKPRAPAFAAIRTRLMERLLEDSEFKILTVIAPPGYGKTVLIGELYRADIDAGREAIWVSASKKADLARTLAHQLADVESEDRDEAVSAVNSWIKSQQTPVRIFVDQFEEFGETDSEAAWFDEMLGDDAASIRWTISSRCSLPIDRLDHLLNGRLREVDYPDLNLSPRESRQLLGPSVCQHLESQDFDFLHEITEGWPAALSIIRQRLAASEHPRSLLKTFSEPHPDFAGYFDSRLLARLTDEERTLMFELSFLPEFDQELCARISSVKDPLTRLSRLQSANRISLSPNGSGALRQQPLIAIHCRAQARLNLDETHRHQILTTAGDWYESRAEWNRAIDVRLLAADYARVVDLLEQHCESIARDQGQLVAMIRWIDALQTRGIEPGPRAHYWYVWALVFGRRYGFANLKIDALKEHLERVASGNGKSEAGQLLSQIQIIKACIAIYQDRIQDTFDLASNWLEHHPNGDPFHVGEGQALVTLAHLDASRFPEAHRSLVLARTALAQSGSRYGLGWTQMFEALLTLREGDVAAARNGLRASMESLRADLGDNSPLIASMELICARCSLDQGLDEEAESLMVSGLRVAQIHGHLDPLVCGVDVAVALWTGTEQEASQLQQLQGLASSYPPRLSLMLNCYRIQALLRLERHAEARELGFEIGLDAEHAEPRFELEELAEDGMCRHLYMATHIQLAIAFTAFERAKRLLKAAVTAARTQNRIGDLVALHLDTMVINVRSAQNPPARQAFTKAVCLAARRKLLRPFRDRMDSIAPLVLNTKPGEWAWANTDEKQFFAQICRDLPVEGEKIRDALEEVGIEPDLIAAMTHREIEFLKLIDLGLSNAQIAVRFELSVSTVKWHLYNLFGKLGANSRTAAVVRAKALNLIS